MDIFIMIEDKLFRETDHEYIGLVLNRWVEKINTYTDSKAELVYRYILFVNFL